MKKALKGDIALASRFKQIREKLQLTQTDLGKIIGKGQPAVLRYETGTYLIPAKVVMALHEKLGITYEWFYNGNGKMVNKEAKKALFKDVVAMESQIQMLQQQVKKLEQDLRIVSKGQ